ncbi:MAG: flagellar biosynthesis protein FlhB [Phycisphaerales bacterium]
MAEELGERTEQPTSRRMSEARSRGQVARSQDLGAAIDLSAAVVLLVAFGGTGIMVLASITRGLLGGDAPGTPLDAESIWAAIAWAGAKAAWLVVPVLLVMFVVGVLAQMSQFGWLWTAQPLQPKFDKLNPVAGLKRLVNRRNLVKTLVNSLKLAAVTAIAVFVVWRRMPTLAALPTIEAVAALYMVVRLALELVLWLLPLLLMIGLVDFLYQRWQHTRDLKMTRQEVQDERRSSEGDPDVKRRRHRMAQEIALHQIRTAVPRADVIVTNPTHFAVALRYDAATMRAPKVVAKGLDSMAFRIREVGLVHGVPIVERPPLARALFWNLDVGQEVRPEHYEAVAEVLAYVYRIAGRAA